MVGLDSYDGVGYGNVSIGCRAPRATQASPPVIHTTPAPTRGRVYFCGCPFLCFLALAEVRPETSEPLFLSFLVEYYVGYAYCHRVTNKDLPQKHAIISMNRIDTAIIPSYIEHSLCYHWQ
jgi:hypothetical protein